MPCFKQMEGGQRAFSVSAFTQLCLAQHNSNAKETYFGVAHSDPLCVFGTIWMQ